MSRDEYFFWRFIVINRYLPFCKCADRFFNLLLHSKLIKNQTESFRLLLWNYWGTRVLILKILPVTRFIDPKASFLTLKMLTRSRLLFYKIIPGAACDKLILALFWQINSCAFLCSLWEVGTREHRPIKENSGGMVPLSIFKIRK